MVLVSLEQNIMLRTFWGGLTVLRYTHITVLFHITMPPDNCYLPFSGSCHGVVLGHKN